MNIFSYLLYIMREGRVREKRKRRKSIKIFKKLLTSAPSRAILCVIIQIIQNKGGNVCKGM